MVWISGYSLVVALQVYVAKILLGVFKFKSLLELILMLNWFLFETLIPFLYHEIIAGGFESAWQLIDKELFELFNRITAGGDETNLGWSLKI